MVTKQTSTVIDRKHARKIIEAIEYAIQTDKPLNRHVTVNWGISGTDKPIQIVNGEFLKKAHEYIKRYTGQGLYSISIFEYHSGCQHAHILIHIPDEISRKFSYRTRGWIKQITGSYENKVIRTKTIDTNDPNDVDNRAKYVLKGSDNNFCRIFDIYHRRQGCITGRRVIHSEALGPKAMKDQLSRHTIDTRFGPFIPSRHVLMRNWPWDPPFPDVQYYANQLRYIRQMLKARRLAGG